MCFVVIVPTEPLGSESVEYEYIFKSTRLLDNFYKVCIVNISLVK